MTINALLMDIMTLVCISSKLNKYCIRNFYFFRCFRSWTKVFVQFSVYDQRCLSMTSDVCPWPEMSFQFSDHDQRCLSSFLSMTRDVCPVFYPWPEMYVQFSIHDQRCLSSFLFMTRDVFPVFWPRSEKSVLVSDHCQVLGQPMPLIAMIKTWRQVFVCRQGGGSVWSQLQNKPVIKQIIYSNPLHQKDRGLCTAAWVRYYAGFFYPMFCSSTTEPPFISLF